jgi:hypothetical protein
LTGTLRKREIEEINELQKDVDAPLSVLDHWVTPGAGLRYSAMRANCGADAL